MGLKKNMKTKCILWVLVVLVIEFLSSISVFATEFQDGSMTFSDQEYELNTMGSQEQDFKEEFTPKDEQSLFDDGVTDSLSEDFVDFTMENPIIEDEEDLEAVFSKFEQYTGYYVGKITNADYLGYEEAKIVIDKVPCKISENFDTNKATKIWVEYPNSSVLCTFENGILLNLDRVQDIVTPKINLVSSSVGSFVYANKKYMDKEMNIEILLTNEVSSKNFYNANELNKVKGLAITGFNLRICKEGLSFLPNKNETMKNVYLPFSIPVGESKKFKFSIYPDENYIPKDRENKIPLDGIVKYSKERESILTNNDVFISITKLNMSSSENNSSLQKAYKEAEHALNQTSAIALDENIRNYFSKDQIKEIKRFLTIWIGESIQAEYFKPDTITEKYQKKVLKSILKKLNVSIETHMTVRSIKGTIKITGETISHGNRTFEFQFAATSFAFNQGSWGDSCKITYRILNDSGIQNLPVKGSGMVTFVKMDVFLQKLESLADSAISGVYKKVWGSDAKKVAALFVETPMAKYLTGKFMDKSYELMSKPIKKSIKRHYAKCPVDMYVYGWDGELCGSIVNNQIQCFDSSLYMNVIGDEKYITYLGNDYVIKLVGNGTGTMEYGVMEYQDNNYIKKFSSHNIPIEPGVEYYGLALQIPVNQNCIYTLMSSSGQEISFTESNVPEQPDLPQKFEQGKCGENAIYTWDPRGTLRISGTGSMYSYKVVSPPDKGEAYAITPWRSYEDNITHIIVESGITGISDFAFGNCKSLQYAEIGDSVTTIGRWSFWKCSQLSEIYVGKNVKQLGEYAFSYCPKLKNVTIHKENPNFVMKKNILLSKDGTFLYKYLDDGASACIVPSGVTVIWDDAFGNTDLKKITLPNSVITICDSAFSDCSHLENIVLGNGVSQIEDFAFSNCTSLQKISLPDSIHTVGDKIFEKCKNLEMVILSKNLTQIGSEIFEGCIKLTSAGGVNSKCNIRFKWKNIPLDAFCNIHVLKHIEIPEYVENIGDRAFKSCKNIKTVEISNAPVRIGVAAFADCNNLERIDIPYSETKLAENCFMNCPKLIIYGLKDSSADLYAQKNNILFQPLHALDAPKLSEVKESYNSITISWKPQNGISGYVIYRKIGYEDWKKYATVKASSTQYKDNKVEAGYTYTYTVKAYLKKNGKIQYSSYDSKGKSGKLTTSFKIASPKVEQATLSWKTTKGANGYYIYRADFSEFGPYNKIKTIKGGNKRKFTDTGLYRGHTYYYKIAPFKIINDIETEGSQTPFKRVSIRPNSVMIHLNRVGLSMKKNTSFHLKATVDPKKYQNTLKWSSSNTRVATVSNSGLVIAKAKGTTVIHVTAAQNAFATCIVTVGYAQNKFAFKNETIVIRKKSYNDKPYVIKEIDNTSEVKWKSKNEHILTVKDGVIYTDGGWRGVTRVIAEKGGKKISCYVIVLTDSNKIKTGTYGKRCSWELYPNDHILHINGDGNMPNVANKSETKGDEEYFNSTPWHKHKLLSQIKYLDIDDQLTSIGDRAFYDMKNLVQCNTLRSIVRVGNEAFVNCSNLEYLMFTSKLKSVGKKAFIGCKWIHFNGKPPKFIGNPFSENIPVKVTYSEQYKKEWEIVKEKFSSNIQWESFNMSE